MELLQCKNNWTVICLSSPKDKSEYVEAREGQSIDTNNFYVLRAISVTTDNMGRETKNEI